LSVSPQQQTLPKEGEPPKEETAQRTRHCDELLKLGQRRAGACAQSQSAPAVFGAGRLYRFKHQGSLGKLFATWRFSIGDAGLVES
jgi:hypothetical protein